MSRGPGIGSCRYDDDWRPSNTGGEGLAVADHGIVVVGANANYQQYSTGACTALTSTPNNAVAGEYTLAAPASGQLATTGVIPGTTYVLGAGGLGQNRWKDVLRLVYTGCRQNDGKCAPTIPRATRCSSAVRTNLLNNYGRLFNGSNCGGPGNCTQLRKAYRPDDASDMAPLFLDILGVSYTTSLEPLVSFDSQNSRRNGINGIGRLSATSTKHPFCDAHDFEGVLPSQTAIGAPVVMGGDPIRRACAPEDDICARDGQMGVVRAIISVPEGKANAYPKVQCSRGSYALTPYFNSALPTCPNGIIPIGGSQCFMPFYLNPVTGRDFNCINDFRSRPPGAGATFDGRVYNAFIRDSVTGAVETQGPSMPHMAHWRENMVQIDDRSFGAVFGPFASAKVVCQLEDGTQNIGCIVGNTTCAWGFGARAAAEKTDAFQSELGLAPGTLVDLSLKNEAFSINGRGPTSANLLNASYPLAHELFLNSIDGFENLTDICLAANRTFSYCSDQVRIAEAFYDATPNVRQALSQAGYLPKTVSICRGGQGTIGCGASDTTTDALGRPMQEKSACWPQ